MNKMIHRSGPSGLAWVLGLAVSAAGLAATGLGCGGAKTGDGNSPGRSGGSKAAIQNCGSDTMVQLVQVWAAEYKKVSGVEVEVTGGGSGVGINNLMKGLIQIANASREMKQAEMDQVKKNTGKEAVEFIVGFDGIGVYVHKNNPIQEITLEDLAAIYVENGTIKKWSQLGVTLPGNDNIVVVSRQNSSGTYGFFQEHVLNNKDFRQGMQQMSGSEDVVKLVGSTPGAIGYSGMGYKNDAVKFVKIAVKKGETSYAPSVENVLSKKYALARSLIMYTLGQPEGEVKKYLDWILSAAGQKLVEKEGYIPVPAK